MLPCPRGMLGQCARSPGGAETRRPGPGARHAERKGPATARGTAPAGTDGARACARACAPPPGLGSPRAASCAGLSPLRRTWGEATLAWSLAEEVPFPPATPINKPHQPRVPGALRPPWAGVLPAPSRPARARRPRPRFSWRSRARLAAPLRSARSPLLAFPGLPVPYLLLCSIEGGAAGVEEEDRVISEQVRSLDNSRTRPPLGSAATCSFLAQVLARPPARSRPLPGAAADRCCMLIRGGGGGGGERSGRMLALGLRCSLDAFQLLSQAQEL